MKIKKGDKVIVVQGRDKLKMGVVERVYEKSDKLLVKGINLYKKHVKKSEAFPKGGIVEVERPLTAGKVMIVCPKCKKRARISYKLNTKGNRERVCRQCKQVIK
jgi:large subunit ribosomal protein L24